MAARVVDQDLPHKLRGDGKKMRTILPLRQVLLRHAYVRFMNQRGALQGVIGAFFLKIAAGDAVEFVVDERHQQIERGLISATPAHQQFSNLFGRLARQVSPPQDARGGCVWVGGYPFIFSVSICFTRLRWRRFPSCPLWLRKAITTRDTKVHEGKICAPEGLFYCTVKFVADEAAPPFVVILTLPVTAPVGTTALTELSEFTVKVAFTPPMVTAVVWLKLIPVIMTVLPTGPALGLNEAMEGRTLKVCGVTRLPLGSRTVTCPVVAPAAGAAIM